MILLGTSWCKLGITVRCNKMGNGKVGQSVWAIMGKLVGKQIGQGWASIGQSVTVTVGQSVT